MSVDNNRIAAIQQALREAGFDGWLFYDFRGSDPLAARILKLDPQRHMTRRWYYLIPAQGVPKKLLHRIEPHSLDDVPGESRLYLSWQEQHEHLRRMLQALSEGKSEAPAQPGRARGSGASETAPAAARAPAKIAMQYSPLNAIPYISCVDAGTIELVRSLGVEVVTSADLVQRFEAVWTKDQYASHCEAAAKLLQIGDDAIERVREERIRGATFTERDLQQDILARITARGMHTYAPPIAAINAHAADPHYSPPEHGSSPIRRGDLVLIDLWAKNTEPGSMYGDITWTGYVGESVPARHAEIFAIVARAPGGATWAPGARGTCPPPSPTPSSPAFPPNPPSSPFFPPERPEAWGRERAPGRSGATVASGASTSGLFADRTRRCAASILDTHWS